MPTLRAILSDPAAFDLNHALFAEKRALSVDSDCLVLDTSDVDVNDVPDAAREAGYDYILMMDDVDSVIENLTDQVDSPSDALRFSALRFYLDRDAFIAL